MKGKIRRFSLCRSAPQVYFAQEKESISNVKSCLMTSSAAHSAAAAELPAANVNCILTTISCDSHWDRNENCGDSFGSHKIVYFATLMPEQSIAPGTVSSEAIVKRNSSVARHVPRAIQQINLIN